MKTFSYQKQNCILHGKQIYQKDEYSFDFIPNDQNVLRELAGTMGTTSLSIGTLQIEIGIEHKNLLYVWGYHPWFNWKTTLLPEIRFSLGCVTLSSDHKLTEGITLAIDEGQNWQTFRDSNLGYIIITRCEDFLKHSLIKIADGCMAELKGDSLLSLCLRVEH